MKYLLRRFAFYLVAAWTSVTLAFVVPRMMPGDPASAMVARFAGKLKPEALGALRQAFGFTDAPLPKQYRTSATSCAAIWAFRSDIFRRRCAR
jgi:peptide/nickel transport system permease protein